MADIDSLPCPVFFIKLSAAPHTKNKTKGEYDYEKNQNKYLDSFDDTDCFLSDGLQQ